MKVGFIGVGSQGNGMAQMISKSGHQLTLWARRPEVLPPFVELGAKTAASPAKLAEDVDVLGICVVSDADVNEVVLDKGVLDAMPRGSVLAIHSTVAVSTCQSLAAKAAPRGISVIDAPVSGSSDAALARKLVVMVGGETKAVEKARPVFETFSNCIIPLGPLGSGQRAKLVNNFLFSANAELARAALEMGAQAGIDRAALKECLLNASARSYALTNIDSMLRPELVDHMIKLFSKDVQLAIEFAHEMGAEMGLIEDAAKGLLHSFENIKRATK